MLKIKSNFEKIKRRYDAFWQCEVSDRPLVNGITFQVKNPKKLPAKKYNNYQEKWLDIDYRIEQMITNFKNQTFFADALPIAQTNMGPEIFSAWYGCNYHFYESTTWTEPCINNWESDSKNATLDMNHPLFKKLEEFTIKLLERGKDEYITALTDFHAGGDHLAALRDPQNLAIDLIENPNWVKKKLKESQIEYYKAYNHFYNLIKSYNMPITTWLTLISDKKYYVPSNDFSCMISTEMFEEFFIDGIINECKFYDHSIYHLDGPGALRHLDLILSIKDLNAVQWVPGAGNEGLEKWIEVYKKIQNAKKGIYLYGVTLDNLDLVFENLNPNGVCIDGIKGANTKESAEYALKRIKNWK